MFSFNILEKFAYTRPSGKELGPDVCTCDRTNNVTFTIKTAYVAFTLTDNNIQQDRLKKMQNLNVPERIRIFIWQVDWEGMKTKHFLFRSHLSDPFCNNYNRKVEFISHALRDCNTISHI